jgi:two-component system, NtrC family, sensor kinase
MTELDVGVRRKNGQPPATARQPPIRSREASRGHILVVEDEADARTVMRPILEHGGYEVSFAENGRDALWRLFSEALPDIIVLDLKMPVMDGWEFRAIQKKDPTLGLIPVLAVSADASAKATSISADAYLTKPLDAPELLSTIDRVLIDTARNKLARLNEAERLEALSRLAAGVGHEINNPLAFVLMNLDLALEQIRPSVDSASGRPEPEAELRALRASLDEVTKLLSDCRMGSERIRDIVKNLQRLSRRAEEHIVPVDVHELIEQSVAMVWNQIQPRAQLVRNFRKLPTIGGNGAALGQVFLNLLVNAAQAIPAGDAEHNEIRVSTWIDTTEHGAELVVEVRDSGQGMAPEVAAHVFEPFFTTKALGEGTGLGLALSLQTVSERKGRITVESESNHGTAFRVFLPLGDSELPAPGEELACAVDAQARARILVIDDEPLIGGVIRAALRKEHDVVVLESAGAALLRLENGEIFDLVLCDMAMPLLTGPEFYAQLERRWPRLLSSVVFMTGGAVTPMAVAFLGTLSTPTLSKPFNVATLRQLVHDRLPVSPTVEQPRC